MTIPNRRFEARDTESDREVVRQMFTEQHYNVSRLHRGPEIVAMYDAMVAAGKTPLIIDAGANIGASTVYFAQAWPKARIVAIEPEAANFKMLVTNTEGLDVITIHGAVSSEHGSALVTDPGIGAWGHRTEYSRDPVPGSVCSHAIGNIVEPLVNQGRVPFIVKIDIEGGEDDLFSNATRNDYWVDDFPLIIIELHDWLLPGHGTSRNFLRCMADRDRDFVSIGENIFSIRNGGGAGEHVLSDTDHQVSRMFRTRRGPP